MREGTVLLDVVVVVFVLAVIAALTYLIYIKVHQEKYTRERYAYSCLLTSSSIIAIALANISPREGVADHVYIFLSRLFGQEPSPAHPPSVVEQLSIVAVAGFAVHLIWRSYREWGGLTSADEAERRRRHQPPSIVKEGTDEALRIIKRSPARALYKKSAISSLQAVLKSPAHDVVWHEHARQLFELWNPNAIFRTDTDEGWDDQWKCWYGQERHTRGTVVLLCSSDKPTEHQVTALIEHLQVIFPDRPHLYIAIRRQDSEVTIDSVNGVKITTISEGYLLENIADFSDYFYDINRRVESTALPESNLTIRDIYVPSCLEAPDGRRLAADMETHLARWSVEASGRQLVILGEYGQGKSTGALMFVYHSLKSQWSMTGGRIPILFELRGKSPANLLPAELLATWAQQYRLQALAIIKLLMAGRLILIFEGFDEMANVSDMESRLAHFRALWRLSYPNAKLLFTGRRNLFFLEQEIDLVFGGAERSPADPYCEILHLRPFDLNQIEAGLRWTKTDVAAGILQAAKENDQMLDIIARPSLLYIVACLWPELKQFASSGAMTSATVIGKFIEHSYRRQAEKAIGSPSFMSLLEGERRYFHEGLAAFMATVTGNSNQITQPEFTAAVELLFENYPDDRHLLPPAMTEGAPRPLKIRLADADNPVEQVATDVRTHGILVSDMARRGAFKFAHKSFFEALYAKVAAYSLLDIDSPFYRAIDQAIPMPLAWGVRSPEMVKFFAETFVERISSDGGKLRTPNEVVEESFDRITGNKSSYVVIRSLQRLLIQLQAEVSYTRYGVALSGVIFGILAASTMVLVFATLNAPAPSFGAFVHIESLFAGSLALAVAGFFVTMMYRLTVSGAGSKQILLWAALFLLTNRESDLNDNRLLSRRATRAVVKLAQAEWDIHSATAGGHASTPVRA
jgi:hypothetical protein